MTAARNPHRRDLDHFGQDSDEFVGLSAAIGPFPAQTPVKYVLEWLASQVGSLTASTHRLSTFTLNAYVLAPGSTVGSAPGNIRSVFALNAVVKKTQTSSLTLNAYVIKGGTFTLNAWVRGYASFTLDAFVVV